MSENNIIYSGEMPSDKPSQHADYLRLEIIKYKNSGAEHLYGVQEIEGREKKVHIKQDDLLADYGVQVSPKEQRSAVRARRKIMRLNPDTYHEDWKMNVTHEQPESPEEVIAGQLPVDDSRKNKLKRRWAVAAWRGDIKDRFHEIGNRFREIGTEIKESSRPKDRLDKTMAAVGTVALTGMTKAASLTNRETQTAKTESDTSGQDKEQSDHKIRNAALGALAIAGAVALGYYLNRSGGGDLTNHVASIAHDTKATKDQTADLSKHVHDIQASVNHNSTSINEINNNLNQQSAQINQVAKKLGHVATQVNHVVQLEKAEVARDTMNAGAQVANHAANLDLHDWSWDLAHQLKPGNEITLMKQAMADYAKQVNMPVAFAGEGTKTVIEVGGRVVNDSQMQAINSIVVKIAG